MQDDQIVNYVSILTFCAAQLGAFPLAFLHELSRHNLSTFCGDTSNSFTASCRRCEPPEKGKPGLLFLHPCPTAPFQRVVSVVGPGDRLPNAAWYTPRLGVLQQGLLMGECSPSFCFSGRTFPFFASSRHQRGAGFCHFKTTVKVPALGTPEIQGVCAVDVLR
ncbi:hypothetical protein GWK47_003301 [Chionoecetes opilio]|uniref:Uncharacterized protein n=1 Tax=Chionoecetes opilio TaxID=41210 RepID=A0A8J4YSZ9_CHIOP|nr:hypothetical protein GWK47_003301 [Chionoecetes opilio]